MKRTPTKIVIRADASFHIGTGHLMRCLTLAEELRTKGVQVVFVCREHPGNLCELIASKGFEVFRLGLGQDIGTESMPEGGKVTDDNPPAHTPWLGVSQHVDARQTIGILQTDTPWDWLIVDHYALDHRWENGMRKVARKIMAIDDLADRKHDCDLLLDQNYFQEPDNRYKGLIPEKCETLLSPKYALLRPEFREARKFCRLRGNGVSRVLIYFGGSDPDNMTGMALAALNSPESKHLLVDVVIGPINPHQEKLETLTNQRSGTRLHIQPEGFTELMLRADLCIGAGGTTTWERLCLGLPCLVITVAENQEAFNIELNRSGLVTLIGKKDNVSISDIKNSLYGMVEKLKRQMLFRDLPNPVDGLGALRVTEKLIVSTSHALNLRRATLDDKELFYYWANDAVVRKNSFQQGPILWQEHASWFENKLKSSKTLIWVMQTANGLPVGQIRFDVDNNDVGHISYSLDSVAKGRGWGIILLSQGINKSRESGKVRMFQGRVKSTNIASRKSFIRLGFSETIENRAITFRKKFDG